MSRTDRCPRSVVSVLAKTIIWLAAGTLAVASPLFGYYLYLIEEWESYQAPRAEPSDSDIFIVVSGIPMPPAQPASEAGLDEDAEVIGVCVGGQARAYAVASMGFSPTRHVVNDMLGGRAVSVTYCDRRRCSRVFTSESAGGPLALDVGGWKEHKGMMLHVEGVHYSQETSENLTAEGEAPLPFSEWLHERTSWGAWRKAHPNTDVYLGQRPTD
jgi:hypothetical protein